MGLMSKQADQEGRGAWNRMGRGGVEEREQGVKLGEARAKNRRIKKNLKLSLRGRLSELGLD